MTTTATPQTIYHNHPPPDKGECPVCDGAAARIAQLESERAALVATLKASVANHCPDDKMTCGSCSPARALLTKLGESV